MILHVALLAFAPRPGPLVTHRVARPALAPHASLARLDRGFVADAVEGAAPSLVLVLPKGVRNMTAQGTGFVVDVEGERLVMTSAHVAAGGMALSLALPADGFVELHPAEVVGRAAGGLDLALVRLPAAVALPPLALVDSDALRVGDFLVGVGHAGDLRTAASLGVLSGRGELGSEPSQSRPTYLVTDAALAGGMSGGPLLNDEGRVVGVNTLVRPELRGLGNYAICSERAAAAAAEILRRSRRLASSPESATVVLYNDNFNRRARVEEVLRAAGLGEAEARAAMLGAHKAGRGVVRSFAGAERPAAEALRDALSAQDLLVEVEDGLSGDGGPEGDSQGPGAPENSAGEVVSWSGAQAEAEAAVDADAAAEAAAAAVAAAQPESLAKAAAAVAEEPTTGGGGGGGGGSEYSRGLATVGFITLLFASNSPAVHAAFALAEHPPPALLLNAAAACAALAGLLVGGPLLQARTELPSALRDGATDAVDALSVRAGAELGLWKSLGTTANLFGLSLTSADHGAFLIQLTTLLVPLYQGIRGVPIPPRVWAAVGLALGGVALFTRDPSSAGSSAEGDALCVLAACLYATYDLRLFYWGKRVTPLRLITNKITAQAGLSVLALLAVGGAPQEAAAFVASATPADAALVGAVALWSGVVVNSVASFLQVGGQQAVGPARAQVIYASQPLWASLLALLALHESLGVEGLAGGAAFLAAVLLAASAPEPDPDCGVAECEV